MYVSRQLFCITKLWLENAHLNVYVAFILCTLVFSASCVLEFPPWMQLETAIASNAKWKSVYRRNNMVGAGFGELFTCVKGYYLQKHHQRVAALIWLMQVWERTACASKTSTGRKAKAICEEHPHSWLPSKTCINHTWHRCGLWWIDSWQDVATKMSLTKSLNDCDSKMGGKKSLFLSLLHPQLNFISHAYSYMTYCRLQYSLFSATWRQNSYLAELHKNQQQVLCNIYHHLHNTIWI